MEGIALGNCKRYSIDHQPVRTSGVLCEEGQLLLEPAEVVARWFHHFYGVLSISTAKKC